MTPDVLIVGGGVIGLSIAQACTRRGALVTLLTDGRPGATMAAAGMLCPSFEAMQTGGRELADMGALSLALWDGFSASLADDPAKIGYERRGTIGIGYPPGALVGEPATVPDGLQAGGAVLVPGEGQVDPRRLLLALEAWCDGHGVIRRHGRVAALTGDRIVEGVRLADGETVRAPVIVVAVGAGRLLCDPQMKAVRGRAFLVRNVLGLTRVVRSPGVYLAPKSGDTLYVGATEEEEGASRDGEAMADGLWSEACWLAPELRHADVLRRFDGIRPKHFDELPVIGPDPARQGLIRALGHHRNGVLLAPLTGERVADAAAGLRR